MFHLSFPSRAETSAAYSFLRQLGILMSESFSLFASPRQDFFSTAMARGYPLPLPASSIQQPSDTLSLPSTARAILLFPPLRPSLPKPVDRRLPATSFLVPSVGQNRARICGLSVPFPPWSFSDNSKSFFKLPLPPFAGLPFSVFSSTSPLYIQTRTVPLVPAPAVSFLPLHEPTAHHLLCSSCVRSVSYLTTTSLPLFTFKSCHFPLVLSFAFSAIAILAAALYSQTHTIGLTSLFSPLSRLRRTCGRPN